MKRPALILGILLAIATVWFFLPGPAIDTTAPVIETAKVPTAPTTTAPIVPIMPAVPAPPSQKLDSGIQVIVDQLHLPDQPPSRDLEILNSLLTEYGKAFAGNPIGENSDITAALIGGAEVPAGRFFPRQHPAIKDGQLVDRWGTPYWFHPNSATKMEIRSAGPDKQLFTNDDVIANPSPAGLGATPAQN